MLWARTALTHLAIVQRWHLNQATRAMSRDQHPQEPVTSDHRFGSTAWAVIREAQTLPNEARTQVLGPMLCRYWKPIYAYYLSKSRSRHDAEELVQGLLQVLLESDRILQV
jgi:hypothetical protein